LIDELIEEPDSVIIQMNHNNPQLFEPYRLNITTGEMLQLAENNDTENPIESWMTDHAGKLRIASRVKEGTKTTLLYRDNENQNFREVITTDFRTTISPLFFDFDNSDNVFVSSNLGRDKSVIVKFNMSKAEETDLPLFEHEDIDVSVLRYSRKRKVLTLVSYVTDKRHLHFLDSTFENIYKTLEHRLGGYELGIPSMNLNEDKLMVRTFSDRSLGAYFLFDVTDDSLTKIADVSPWLNEEDLSEMTPVVFSSRDGLTIHGYLSLPKNCEAKNLPVVINPHGGPWVRDSWTYNPEVQLLTSRGFAVLQMNYRGSTGYGRKFWESSFKEWGKKMQDDISDGVNWLIECGFADSKRIAIYGGSYGGYATLAGLTFSPELYACGIDYVGVSNLFTFLNTIPPYWKPYLDMMYEMVGHPENDKQILQEGSPVYHIDRIKSPLLVVQGANDPRVNIDESDQIVRALRSRGIEVPYLVKYDEGHGFHNQENQFEFYKVMLGFLFRHLKIPKQNSPQP
jgi:dipeptidyl aminopeptidase/acylaminoacyl peptidase